MLKKLLLFNLKKKIHWILVFMFFSNLLSSQVTISPWKMNKGAGAINFSLPNHGNASAYSQMNIPDTADNNWTNAPVNANGEINFSERSILSRCLQQLDFTYFQTFISIPVGYTINDMNVSFSAADDGARAYIFNSAHPNGAYIGEIGLGGAGTSTNYASLAKAGETNRLVIVQFDDCPTGNNLRGAKVNVNGQAAPINTGGCTTSNFFWSNAPTINGKTASGTINGITYTYTSSVNVRSTSNMFAHSIFPASYNVPNANPTIQNIEPSSNTLTFASPMTNPVLVFSSIGGGPISVPVNFSAPVEILWSTSNGSGSYLRQNSPTQIEGREGYAIVKMKGTFSSISFDYLTYENYVNFAFGADFSTSSPDTVAPTLTLNGSATQTVNYGTTYTDPGANATDVCDTNPAVLVSGSVDTNVPGNYTLTYTAVDASGNTSAPITRIVTVVDPVPVVITQNITVALDGNGNVSITPAQIDNGSSSAVGLSGLALDTTSFGCSNIGVNTVTLTATSTLGSSASATATVTVVDAIPPAINKPADIRVNADNGLCGAVVNFAATATDNCGTATITYDIQPGSVFGVGTTVVKATATDASGNKSESTFNVTVVDNQAPSITSPFDITTNADADLCGARVTYSLPTANDNCGTGDVPTTLAGHTFKGKRNGHSYFLSNTKVTPEVAHANAIAAGGHLVTISDADENLFVSNFISDKIWIGHTDRDVEGQWKWISNEPVTYTNWAPNEPNNAGGNEDWAVINWSGNNPDWNDWYFNSTAYYAIEFDGGTIPTTLVSGPAPGEVFPIGTTTVTYEAVDASGNRVETSFDVTVVDNINPTITSPQDINTIATSAAGAIVNYTAPIGTDNCPVTTVLTTGKASGETFPIGTTLVTYTATDASGNTASSSFNVTVTGVAPSIVSPGDITVSNDAGDCGALVTYEATETTAIPASVITYTIAPGSSFTTGTTAVTATATNAVGSSSITFNVIVNDTELPNVVTQNISAVLDANGNASITAAQINNNSTDNCAIDSVSIDTTAFTCANIGENTVTLTVTDSSGNKATKTAIVTVSDNIAPTVITQPLSINLDANGNASITAAQINNNSTDNCAIESMSLDITSFTCANIGENTVTLTVTDSSGNKATNTATVTVSDNIAPTVITQPTTVYLDANGNASITPAQINNNSTDNCAIESMSLDISSFTCANIGANTVTLTVTDVNGNKATNTAIVTVVDNTAPTVITQPLSVSLDANGNASITAALINNNSTDNCTIESMSLDITSFTCANIGENTVTLTVTDSSGNSATNTAIVTVSDNIAPTVITKAFSIPLANGVANITADDINNGTFDNCDFTLSIDKDTFSCGDIGDHPVTLTATDSSGNSTSETAIVTIEGEIPEVTIANFNAVETQQANTIFLGFGPQSIALETTATGGDSFTYVWTSSTGENVSNVANPVVSPTTSTTYTVTATNNYGCSTTTSIEVCVMDVRSYNKKGKPTNKVVVCHHTNGKKGTKHVMINISKNAVMKHLTLHGAGTSHGDSLGNCNATCITSETKQAPIANDSEELLLSGLEIQVYPNPSKGVFKIKIANLKAETQFNLFDVTGKLVARKITDSSNLSQSISIGDRNLPSGIYILKVISKEETITKKLIVSRE